MMSVTSFDALISSDRGRLVRPTIAVCVGQAAFLFVAYAHAAWSGDIRPQKAHISAVLDDDRRSVICSLVSMISLVALITLERRRALPQRVARLCLAAVIGLGIILTCAVRETYYVNLHRLIAAVTFSSAVALVVLIAWLSAVGCRAAVVRCRPPWSHRVTACRTQPAAHRVNPTR